MIFLWFFYEDAFNGFLNLINFWKVFINFILKIHKEQTLAAVVIFFCGEFSPFCDLKKLKIKEHSATNSLVFFLKEKNWSKIVTIAYTMIA